MAASDPRNVSRPVPVGAGGGGDAMRTAKALAETPVAARPVPSGSGGGSRPIPATAANRPLPANTKPGTSTLRDGEPHDEEATDEVVQEIVRRSPPWAVSTVVHLVILLVLALITWSATRSRQGIVAEFTEPEPDEWSEKLGEQNNIDTTLTTDMPKEQQVISDSPLPPVPDPLAAPPDNPIVEDAQHATSEKTAPDVGMALHGRQRGRRGDLLAAYGGNRLTEEAVLAALEWLARNQQKDGSWSLVGPYSDGASSENKLAATSMALLAFQGHGDTHVPPDPGRFKLDEDYKRAVRYSKIVANGWSAMLKTLEKDGSFRNECIDHERLYAQGQAMIAICEIYAMSKDEKFKEPAQRVVDYAVKIQDSAGGWRYTPGSDSDVSVSGWFMMGLQSARMGQLEVPRDTLDKLSGFLDKVALADGRQYRYRVGGPTTDAMTAEGLLCRQYLGWQRNDPRMLGGMQFVGEREMEWTAGKRNVYYWYYATQVAHHMEGEYWPKWNNVMKQMLPSNQTRKGPEDGSWNPAGDYYGEMAGRLYVTCLSTYMLEVYYRHLPIYRKFDF